MLGINTAILSDLQVRAGVYRPAYMQWRRQRGARPPKRRGYKSVMAARMLQRFAAEAVCTMSLLSLISTAVAMSSVTAEAIITHLLFPVRRHWQYQPIRLWSPTQARGQ